MQSRANVALTHRDRAILRAVGHGNAELLGGAQPDLFLDGRCCSDQLAARRLAHAGLIVAAGPAVPGRRVAAQLSAAGRAIRMGVSHPGTRRGTPWLADRPAASTPGPSCAQVITAAGAGSAAAIALNADLVEDDVRNAVRDLDHGLLPRPTANTHPTETP